MDPKELNIESNDSTKYVHTSPTLSANKSKSYHEIGSTSMGKVDATAVRPCAIIGPDRVLPQTSGDVYLKKTPVEPWPCTENTYRQPPDYPNKLSDYTPIRNISPRQTFQENMQRIMVPPTYSSIKNSDEKNTKLNMPQEAKYCDVPYNLNSVTNELKSVRNSDIPISSVNPAFGRSVPHYGWPVGLNIRPPRPYGAPEIYQYPEYPSCVGPRPVTIKQSHRIHRDEAAQVYSERLYQEANIRFKPYPILKEKHQQARYDYINNYQNTFHPPVTFPPHKYDVQKSLQTHPYPMYPQVPLKYLNRRIHETFVDGYQRSSQQPNFNSQFHNQVIHPPYGPVSGNCVQNKSFTDLSAKPMATNKLPYETNNKIYLELDNSRNKGYPLPDNVYYNDTNHTPHVRGDILLPNRSTLNLHSIPQHQIYRRDNVPLKHYEYNPHLRNFDHSLNLNYSLPRIPLQYSPNTVAISPSDSNTSNDTTHTIGTSQEDCGYVSQSSTNSVRSVDSLNMSAPKDMYRRHNYNIHAIPRNVISADKIPKNKMNSSGKKNIDVRQFLQMWNEGEDEANESNKEIVTQIHPSNFSIPSNTIENQEQLYVLGLVNVPNEELSKYEHIQKISKLPENIKGYNSIELLNQYEELLESPNNNNYKVISKLHKDHNPIPKRPNDKENNTMPRPLSPLDVEAKISQSVIHKEVGCNFEIKPCSPEMLNAEVATPIQSILGERIIEKVSNPMKSKSPILRNEDSKAHSSDISNIQITTSCEMINKQYSVNNYANLTKNNNYNVQDFESNSGISLASLPRLDNDIELNFPEINQQFIKANKIETDTHLFKDLPQLNLDQITHEKNSCQQHSRLSPHFCLGSTPEKEFSKLSKYRKSKKCDMTPKEDNLERNTAQQRINSVIIKNPDTKLLEETDASFSTSNKASYESIDNNYYTEHYPEKLLSSKQPENCENKNMFLETAIDFSLNKNEVTSNDCLNKCTNEPHYFGNSDSISLNFKNIIDKQVISKEQPGELHLKQSREHETVKDNVIITKEPIEHTKIAEIGSSDLTTHKLTVNGLNKEPIELHLNQIRDNEPIKENIINKKPIENTKIEENKNSAVVTHKPPLNYLKEEPMELHLRQIRENETITGNVNKEPIEYTKIEENKNSTMVTYKLPVNYLNKESTELHLKQITEKETIKENVINNEPMEHRKIEDNKNSAVVTHKLPLNYLNEEPMELRLKQIRENETNTENVNKEPIEYTKIEENKNSAVVTHKLPANNLNEEPENFHLKQIRDHEIIKEKLIIDEELLVQTKILKHENSALATHNLPVNDLSKDPEELQLKQIKNLEIIKESVIINKEPIVQTEIVENENIALFTNKLPVNDLNEKHLELPLKQISDHKTVKENIIINEEPTEHTKLEETESSASVSYKLPINYINKENNEPVIRNISIISENEGYTNVQKNNTCIVRQEEISVLETSLILESVDKENSRIDGTTIMTNSNNVNFSLMKKLKNTQVPRQMNAEKKLNCKDNMINQSLEKYDNDKNDKKRNKSEVTNEFDEIPNTKDLFIVEEKDVSLNSTTENITEETTLSDVMENKIDEKNIATNKDLQLAEVLDRTQKNEENHNKEENILGGGEKENIKLEINNKTSDNDIQFTDLVALKINHYSCNVCNQETNRTDAELSTTEIYESNSNTKTFHSVALKSSIIELSESSHKLIIDNENCDSKKIIAHLNTNFESLEGNLNLSTNKENENITNNVIKLDTKSDISKTIDMPTSKEKYTNIAKELYSPWIQKLVIFKEGNCTNIQNNAPETKKEKDKVDILLRNADKTLSKDFKKLNIDIETNNGQDNFIGLENCTSEILKINCDPIEPRKNGEYNKNLPNRDLNVFSVDDRIYNIEENSITPTTDCTSSVRRNVLKRSLSESALEDYRDDENIEFFAHSKRKKRNHNIIHPVISEDLCNIIQTNRRNSISTFYNEDNVFILIDNDLIITEENDGTDKIYYAEMPDHFENNVPQNDCTVTDTTTTVINEMTSVESNLMNDCEEKPVEESWVEDVACIETVVSDDITDDIDYEVMSPKKNNLPDETITDESVIFCDNKHIDKIKNTYGSNMCNDNAQILQTLYMTPQMNVNKTLLDIESHNSVKHQEYKKTEDPLCENKDCLENFEDETLSYSSCKDINEKENINTKEITKKNRYTENVNNDVYVYVTSEYSQEEEKYAVHSISCETNRDYIVQSPKTTISNYSNSSSPEVSSTTPEEKNSSILLKITNHNGSRMSKINETGSLDRLSYKLTETKDYQDYSSSCSSSRTLITKAAQKYIPPLKESIRDLKIKLTLPQHRLHTLKQLKISKVEPKIDDNVIKYSNKNSKQATPKKPKPKFEDVLKSIDEIQFKKHKDKIKKGKNGIPKVVIKKNENGAHFASRKTTNNKSMYNPDLTGRKWQPWVFLEKNTFIDQMAIKNKINAVYCHRKNSYVLAEKFRKYKSIYNANFVISQPCSDCSAKGTLKYTIRLKHK